MTHDREKSQSIEINPELIPMLRALCAKKEAGLLQKGPDMELFWALTGPH